tara:strand:- start:426 stop:617 length:192 start_codon:yes stop_codon:yes gene_type:complete
MIKEILKIMYPITFGFPRPAFQLAEVKEMIEILKSNKIKEKNNKLIVEFDIKEEKQSKKLFPK